MPIPPVPEESRNATDPSKNSTMSDEVEKQKAPVITPPLNESTDEGMAEIKSNRMDSEG